MPVNGPFAMWMLPPDRSADILGPGPGQPGTHEPHGEERQMFHALRLSGLRLDRIARLAAALLVAAALIWSSGARAAEPITIGFGMALTGGLAAIGKTALLAMQIWEAD